jgi:long-chain fatty acid transport protein
MAVAGLALPGAALATDGYFSHGYGMKAKGMGGAATAMSDDAFGGANNPASMVFAGDRLDVGVDLFSPKREASRTGTAAGGALNGDVQSDSNYFAIPEFGYNKMLNKDLSLGVTVYGNGGMNSDYAPLANGSNFLGGQGRLGVDLMQLIVAPTAAYKITPNHSFGISPLIGYQRFRAEGLQGFGINNPGYDDSFGYGVRVGYMGKITPSLTIGAAYASRMNFDKLDKYNNLFAEQGDFDIPENYNVGVAFKATPDLTFALDYQRINYGDVKSINNPSTNILLGNAPGASNGPGFGWSSINVVKLGASYQYNKHWTLRGGYNHSDNPIQSRDVTFNILAPGIVKDHATLGVTYLTNAGNELTVSYMHAFENTVTGSTIAAFGPGGTDTIKMYQNSLGVAYSWKM